GIEAIGRAAQAVAPAGHGLDRVAVLAQGLHVLPDLGPRDALVGGELLPGADAALGAAQGFEHARRAALHRATPPARVRPRPAPPRCARPPDPRAPAGGGPAEGSISSATSAAGAEWVRAPIAMRWTPVAAMRRTFSSVTPPEASSRARPVTLRAIRSSS